MVNQRESWIAPYKLTIRQIGSLFICSTFPIIIVGCWLCLYGCLFCAIRVISTVSFLMRASECTSYVSTYHLISWERVFARTSYVHSGVHFIYFWGATTKTPPFFLMSPSLSSSFPPSLSLFDVIVVVTFSLCPCPDLWLQTTNYCLNSLSLQFLVAESDDIKIIGVCLLALPVHNAVFHVGAFLFEVLLGVLVIIATIIFLAIQSVNGCVKIWHSNTCTLHAPMPMHPSM